MKKLVLIIALLSVTLPSFAGGVGYINYEKVVSEYKFAQNYVKEIETKEAEIQKFLAQKEEEFKKIESPIQKSKFEEGVKIQLQSKEKAYNEFREKREEEVYTRVHAVAEKIRLEKNLDTLLDARSVFSGGVDITDELIKKLNSNQVR
ncbi:MAG: OmpH family outer membrane protein [bacterium]|nr:OmpH family outer membrane protein [bacterium]